jgi:hypothetical protein
VADTTVEAGATVGAVVESGIRARWCQQLVANFEQLSRGQRQGVLDTLDPKLLLQIEQASSLTWLPTGVHLAFMDGLCASLGDSTFHAFHRQVSASTIRSPWLRSLAAGGHRLLGRTAMTKVFPRAFASIVRGYGDLTVKQVQDTTLTTLTFRRVPESAASSRGYPISVASSLEGIMDMLNIEGHAEMDVARAQEGILAFEMHAPHPE